jgi:hypothetical protein
MRKLFILLFLAASPFFLAAQELNCEITVETPKLQTTDPTLFQNLENALNDFMNNKKWTNVPFTAEERIECRIVITITEEGSAGSFKATANIQSIRPVYNSDYKTVIFNYSDKAFNFRYTQYQPIEFSENVYINNLSSLLAYYAYIIIGLDFDTFEENAGMPYFQKAKTIVNQAQTSDAPGWKSYEGQRNRFWVVDNLLSPQFRNFHKALFLYHFEGLDKMYDSKDEATAAILEALKLLAQIESENPNSIIVQLFRTAKSDEILEIFANARPDRKKEAYNYMRVIDIANANKYQKLLR